jgi:hypothetical protein
MLILAYYLFNIIDMATSWDQDGELTTGVESNTIPVNVGINATAVSSLNFGTLLQNLLTMLDGNADAGVAFMKKKWKPLCVRFMEIM